MCFLLLVFVGMRNVDRFCWFGLGWAAMAVRSCWLTPDVGLVRLVAVLCIESWACLMGRVISRVRSFRSPSCSFCPRMLPPPPSHSPSPAVLVNSQCLGVLGVCVVDCGWVSVRLCVGVAAISRSAELFYGLIADLC